MTPDDQAYRSRLLGQVALGMRTRNIARLKEGRRSGKRAPLDLGLRRALALIEDDELPTREAERLLAELGLVDDFLQG